MPKNELFEAKSLKSYVEKYSVTLQQAVAAVPAHSLERAKSAILGAERIFIAGNGGSAALSEHFATDLAKLNIPALSLVSNSALLTMLSNDVDFSQVFYEQLSLHRARVRDLLILVSSSGASENIKGALDWAHVANVPTVGFTGFDGGLLRAECDVSLHIPVRNYGVVEDAHSCLMHCLVQSLKHSAVTVQKPFV